jgi:hypothetical protein
MELSEVVSLIEEAKAQPVETWPGYDFASIPVAVYNDDDVVYLGHPNPPETRPNNLMAATNIDINGVQTAIIPMWLCTTPEAAVPIAYHEGFHVYQQTAFAKIQADMFTAMSYFPELVAEYRALCRLEIDVLRREDWSAGRKLETLAALSQKRREHLTSHDSLLDYARFLEQNEGTASYVEQKSRRAIFGIDPTLDDVGQGWSHFYQAGAATAWLMDEALPGWTSQIEQGQSFGDILMTAWDGSEVDLNALDYERVLQEEQAAVSQLRQEIDTELDTMQRDGLLRIRYPAQGKVFRAFRPATLISLGDGRILHRSNFTLMLPDRGSVSVKEMPAIDDIANHEVHFAAVPVTLEDGTLSAKADQVEINVSGATRDAESVYHL